MASFSFPLLVTIILLMLHCKSREVISDIQIILEPDRGMILIPEGTFMMGNAMTGSAPDEQPLHEVFLSAYYIAQNLVTNEQYLEFWSAQDGGNSSRNTPINVGSQPWPNIVNLLPKHPVVGVSLLDAKAYANWKSRRTGKQYRLPTEAEWEKAARGTDQRLYPWGNENPDLGKKYRANYLQSENTHDGFVRTSPVSYFNGINLNTGNSASPYGLYDMSGNVWQWVEDLYSSRYYSDSPAKDPRGPNFTGSTFNVVRGGSYLDEKDAIRSTNRDSQFSRNKRENIGFRIVMEY